MKRLCSLVVVAAVVIGTAAAQPKELGIGIIFGAPTGFSLKYWDSSKYALQGSVGGLDGVTVGVDYTIHSDAFDNRNLPFYYGPGVFLGSGGPSLRRAGRGNFVLGGQFVLGGRFMFGVDYLFANDPFDIAFEIGPAILLAPDVDLGMEVGLAFRFYP